MSNIQSESVNIIAPPLILYIGTLVTGLILHAVLPQPILSSTFVFQIIGTFFLIMSGAFARWAFVTMRRIGTSANPHKQSKVLVTSGPFQLSRNPIYLAMTGLYIAVTLIFNSLWLLVLLMPLLAIMQWGVIFREERYLSKQFGKSYSAYKASTGRWF